MAYNKTTWENSPSTNSPINASNLNKIEEGIYQNSLGVEENSTNIGTLSNLETTNKSSIVGAINELKDGLDEKQDAFIIESITLETNKSFSANNSYTFSIPARTGYTAYVLKPYVTGEWADKYAVYVPYNSNNNFAIGNIKNEAFTWSVYCVALYIKNTE